MVWFRRKEHRESSYTDALVTAIVNWAGGAVSANPLATGALEACAGLYGRALAAAETAGGSAAAAVTPSVLMMAGRELIRQGELVLLIDVGEQGVRLLPVADYDVQGGFDPSTWRYRLTLQGPDRNTTRSVAGAAVVHLRYATEPARPWKGLGPLDVASLTGRLHAELEHALGDEASGPRGAIIPTPKDGQDPTMVQLRDDVKKLAGSVATVESTAASWAGTP